MNTHILVLIDDWNNVIDAQSKIQPIKYINSCLRVDLSEEGIANKIYQITKESEGASLSNAYFTKGYTRCAKDLLNTKP